VARTQRLISTLVAAMGASLFVGSVAHAQEPLVALEPELEGIITVEPGEDTLHDAVEEAEPGDTLVLEPGLYVLTHTVLIEKDLTIRGATEDREDVHIAGASEDFDFEPEIFGDLVEDVVNWGHLLFVRAPAEKVSFSYFTIKGAPEIGPPSRFTGGASALNHTECFGDAIHVDGVAEVEVDPRRANGGTDLGAGGEGDVLLVLGVNNGASASTYSARARSAIPPNRTRWRPEAAGTSWAARTSTSRSRASGHRRHGNSEIDRGGALPKAKIGT
jgi:hypothetical protein